MCVFDMSLAAWEAAWDYYTATIAAILRKSIRVPNLYENYVGPDSGRFCVGYFWIYGLLHHDSTLMQQSEGAEGGGDDGVFVSIESLYYGGKIIISLVMGHGLFN